MRRIMAKIIVIGSHPESLVNFRKEMLQLLAQQNQVLVLVPDANAKIIQDLDLMGIEYKNIKLSRTGLNPLADLATLKQLYLIFKQVQPEQVFAYTSKPIIFGLLAAKLAGVKQTFAMITGLGSYYIHSDLKSLIIRLVMSLLYKLALLGNTIVFFQNPDDRRDFAQYRIFNSPDRSVMINGSGVNIKHFQPAVLMTQNINFLLIARFIQAKGIFEYLTAAEQLKQQYPQANFLLVGWTESKDEAISPDFLQTYINNKTITNLGRLSDVRTALAQANVFVLPSYREGTPRSVLEAMASGLPIITTDVPGCRETVIDGDNGFLVPAKNIAALRSAMEKFILNPHLIISMGQRSRELAVAKYDVDKVNSVILQAMGYQYA